MLPDAGAIAAPAIPLESVHLWAADLGRCGPGRYTVADLSRDERARVERIRDPAHRHRKGASRSFLRRTLSRYLGTPPHRIDLTVGPHGKPRLAPGASAGPTLHFNLAHTDDFVLLAVSGASQVGVDVERVRELDDLEALERRCLTAAEAGRPREADVEPAEGFLRLWTRKEALLKGLGLGLTLEPRSVSVLDPGKPDLTEDRAEVTRDRVRGWTLIDLTPWNGFVGALAVEIPGLPVRRFVDDSFL